MILSNGTKRRLVIMLVLIQLMAREKIVGSSSSAPHEVFIPCQAILWRRRCRSSQIKFWLTMLHLIFVAISFPCINHGLLRHLQEGPWRMYQLYFDQAVQAAYSLEQCQMPMLLSKSLEKLRDWFLVIVNSGYKQCVLHQSYIVKTEQIFSLDHCTQDRSLI